MLNLYILVSQKKQRKEAENLFNQLCNTKSLMVIGDEKYFCFAGDNMRGNFGYYTNITDTCPESVRFVGKGKFPKTLLMCIAVSDCGMSLCFVLPLL